MIASRLVAGHQRQEAVEGGLQRLPPAPPVHGRERLGGLVQPASEFLNRGPPLPEVDARPQQSRPGERRQTLERQNGVGVFQQVSRLDDGGVVEQNAQLQLFGQTVDAGCEVVDRPYVKIEFSIINDTNGSLLFVLWPHRPLFFLVSGRLGQPLPHPCPGLGAASLPRVRLPSIVT